MNWCWQGPSMPLLVQSMAASVQARVAAAEGGMGQGEGQAHSFHFPCMAACREDARQRVLPVLLCPPELPKKTIYAYVCAWYSDGGTESPGKNAQDDRDPAPGSS